MDHFIKETLKIKYYVRYQDDFLLFHPSKEYLKYCFEQIRHFLQKEKLSLNQKSRIYKNTTPFLFLGRTANGKYAHYRNMKRKIKYRRYLYESSQISLQSYISSLRCFKQVRKKVVMK